MKLLITGAAGRIGSVVVREFLDHGYQVRALDNVPLPADLRERGAEAAYADITQPLEMLRAVDGCEGLIHLAAIPSPGRNSTFLLDTNIKGTYNALEAAHAVGIQKTVVTSSVGALGFSFPVHPIVPDYLPVDSAHPRRPQDVYGLSKLVNEETTEMFVRRYGMTAVVIRPPFVGDLYRMAKDGWLRRMVERGTNEFRNDLWGYVHVVDLARAFRLAWEAQLDTGTHVFYAMADDVLSAEPASVLIERFLPSLAQYAGRAGNCLYDLAPAREKLGFTAEHTWRQALEEA